MQSKDIILNIAVNLGRLGRWAADGRHGRIPRFLTDTESYISQINDTSFSPRFQSTYNNFLKAFASLKRNPVNDAWAETAFTWANILTHRAKLA